MKKILIISLIALGAVSCKKENEVNAFRINKAQGDVFLTYDGITIDMQKNSDITLHEYKHYYINVECFGACSYSVNGQNYTSSYKLK